MIVSDAMDKTFGEWRDSDRGCDLAFYDCCVCGAAVSSNYSAAEVHAQWHEKRGELEGVDE